MCIYTIHKVSPRNALLNIAASVPFWVADENTMMQVIL